MRNQRGSAIAGVFAIVFCFVVLTFLLGLMLRSCAWLSRAQDVAMHELDPGVMLKKYMWFKDASAALDKKLADLKVYSRRLETLDKAYEGQTRGKWARDDREQYSVWSSECAGISASYNDLAAEYNSAMSKINWRFTNVGQLPAGVTEPLPREYKPYQVN